MPITPSNPFPWRQYPGEVIVLCVRWYLQFPLSSAHVAEMMQERGLAVDRSCIWRWVQDYAPELTKRRRPHRKPAGKSWRVDETTVKLKGEIRYLYRAVDSTGQTIEFLLTAKRDAAAAQRFLQKALTGSATPQPRVITVDKNPAYPTAVGQLQADGALRPRCRLRQGKFLNNMVEQDHRIPKQRVRLTTGYHSFRSAWRTLQGTAALHLIRKGRARRVAKGNAVAQARSLGRLFGLAALPPPASESSPIPTCSKARSSQQNLKLFTL